MFLKFILFEEVIRIGGCESVYYKFDNLSIFKFEVNDIIKVCLLKVFIFENFI